MRPTIERALHAIAHNLAERGKVIAGGAEIMLHYIDPKISDADELRYAFFAGAQHLFATIMAVMDEDREPTPRDMAIMDKINHELEDWRKQAALRLTKPASRG